LKPARTSPFNQFPWRHLFPTAIARDQPKADMRIGRAFSALASGPEAERLWATIEAEYERSVQMLLRLVRRDRLLDASPVLQRSIGDLMRYVALVQGANSFDRFGDFALVDPLPDPALLERYSDDQLHALGRYLYSLKPPPNPNRADAAADRGRRVFSREGCADCHTPPLYSSNKLTPAVGFTVPAEHLKRYDIINRVVGTDPALALRTRKGTGYYKVPSLKGVWYRGPFQHSGAARTLEDWFDPARVSSVPGHPFGLTLSAPDRRALIAFLRTL
jgi:hypothetical protein